MHQIYASFWCEWVCISIKHTSLYKWNNDCSFKTILFNRLQNKQSTFTSFEYSTFGTVICVQETWQWWKARGKKYFFSKFMWHTVQFHNTIQWKKMLTFVWYLQWYNTHNLHKFALYLCLYIHNTQSDRDQFAFSQEVLHVDMYICLFLLFCLYLLMGTTAQTWFLVRVICIYKTFIITF